MAQVLLPPLIVTRKTGNESFRNGQTTLAFDLLSFWQWSASDLASNALRGMLAEYLVAQALGIADGLREEWAAFDLRTREGITIEVKSAAYLQTWAQTAHSIITFGIAPTQMWQASTNEWASEKRRQADLYVFALLAHQDKPTLDAMDLSQWEFYLLPSAIIDARLPNQRQLSLSTLLKLDPARCSYGELGTAIERLAVGMTRQSQSPQTDWSDWVTIGSEN
jgi:hypothetical protein